MEEAQLKDEQIENWRKILSLQIGSYAFIMPKEEVQQIKDNMQKHINKGE